MNKSILKTFLLCLIGALCVIGCAKPQANETLAESNIEPVTEVAVSDPQDSPDVETVIDKQPAQNITQSIVLKQVPFDFDQSTLTAQARQILSSNAEILNAMPELKVSIEGHCDDRGSDEYNLALGDRRALSVQAYLVSLGVAAERLETISYGEEKPVVMAYDEIARAKNRRAELRLLN